MIEIEGMDAALELTASGLGDTIAPKAAFQYRPSFRTLESASFAEPLYDDFAFIARRATHRSPPPRARSSSSPSGDWPSSAKASLRRSRRRERLIGCR